MALVSVIVPIYKVASYIERCARSLFEQSLEDMEFIFVDDCSPDNSIEIMNAVLKAYPQRQNQVRIIRNRQNMGSAFVRRVGMQASTGMFVIQCDGDDFVDVDLYEKMYEMALLENADIVVCDEKKEYADKTVVDEVRLISNECPVVLQQWYSHVFAWFVHNKLVRRSLYVDNDVYPWDGLDMLEDNGLMMRLFYYGRKVVHIEGSYYHYNKANTGAMTFSYGEKSVEQMISIAENLTYFFESKTDYKLYEKTVSAVQFLAKINLITNSFSKVSRYRRLFPGSEKIIAELDKKSFSRKGLARFLFVKYHLTYLFILLFKVYALLRK